MFVLYRETRNGVFDLGGHSRLSVILEELAALQRAGERSPLRIVDGAGKLVLRSEPLPQGEAAAVVFARYAGQGVCPSQHVQVKSAVESHFETVGSGGQAVLPARLAALGYSEEDLEACNPYVHGWGR